MITKIMSKPIIAAIFSLTMAFPSYAAVTNTFTAGQAANASEVNDNFTDLDGRVSALESNSNNNNGGSSNDIAVNCLEDPNALAAVDFASNTTYHISSDCIGPIYINNKENITLSGTGGSQNSFERSSIILPVLNNGSAAVNVQDSNGILIDNLFLDITIFHDLATANETEAAGINARQSFVIVRDVNIEGGLYGMNSYRGAIVRLEGTVNVTEFLNLGLSAGDQSTITARGPVTVTSTLTNGDYITAVESYRNGVVDFREGVIISVPANLLNSEPGNAITSTDNSNVRIRNSGTVTIAGDMGSYRSSSIYIQKGSITGNLEGGLSSSLHLTNGVMVTGSLDIFLSSSLLMVDGSISGTIGAITNGSIELVGVDHTNDAFGSITLDTNGTLLTEDSNLGHIQAHRGASIDIGTESGASSVAGGALHLGVVGSISNTEITADVVIHPPAAVHLTGTTDFNNNDLICDGTSSFVANTVTNIGNEGNNFGNNEGFC
jgi:hypothetical protein